MLCGESLNGQMKNAERQFQMEICPMLKNTQKYHRLIQELLANIVGDGKR
jgi:hypothetical protein